MTTVLITGATGFLGEHVLAKVPEGVRAIAFARSTSDIGALPPGIEIRRGNLDEAASLRDALSGCDALLNLASLGFGHAPKIIKACREARTQRVVFIGTTAVFTTLPAHSKEVRLKAEREIFESGLRYTLLRPTMIYGTPKDRNIWRLIEFVKRSPVIPLVRGGVRLQQPVHVDDVADAAWKSLRLPRAEGLCLNIAGAQPLTMRAMVQSIAHLLGRRVALLPVPLPLALAAAAITRSIPGLPKISAEQVLRLDEDKSFDNAPAICALGWSPRTFEEGVRQEMTCRPSY